MKIAPFCKTGWGWLLFSGSLHFDGRMDEILVTIKIIMNRELCWEGSKVGAEGK